MVVAYWRHIVFAWTVSYPFLAMQADQACCALIRSGSFPPDQLPHIFERFYRAGTRSGGSGSGLGLAIAAEVASAHGGTAQAAPVSPRGLRVTLTLPVRSAPRSESELAATAG